MACTSCVPLHDARAGECCGTFDRREAPDHVAVTVVRALLQFGFAIPFYTFHPHYTEADWITFDTPVFFYIAVALFALSELMSLLSVIHLSTV